jgi:hypothetical protein
LRRVVSEGDSLGDVALETFYSSLEEDLLALVDVGEWVESLFGTVDLALC